MASANMTKDIVGNIGAFMGGQDPRLGTSSNKKSKYVSAWDKAVVSANDNSNAQLPAPPPPQNPYNEQAVAAARAAAAAEAQKRAANEAARNATLANIRGLDTALSNSLGSIDSNFARIMQQYADEEAINLKAYNDQVGSNEKNRSTSIQAGQLSAAQGARGLLGVLGSLNALGGTGQLLANRAVATEANKDIGEANRTFDTNATTLANARAATEQDEKNRRAEAEAARENQKVAARANTAQQKQSLFEKMAGYFNEIGDAGQAGNYLAQVGALAPEVARGATVQASAYTPRSAVFNPGQLQNYLAGANDMTVKASGGGGNAQSTALNSPLYSLARKREEQLV